MEADVGQEAEKGKGKERRKRGQAFAMCCKAILAMRSRSPSAHSELVKRRSQTS